MQYQELDSVNKAIVTKHYRIAGTIDMLENINDFLINQIHSKKSTLQRSKYIITDALTHHYYSKYLYRGQKNLNSLDPYPSTFKSHLEDSLAQELIDKRFKFIGVYYSRRQVPVELRFDTFDENEWILSEGPSMIQNDIIIMERYKTRFTSFLDFCVDVASNLESKKLTELQRIRNKIVTSMNLAADTKTPLTLNVICPSS